MASLKSRSLFLAFLMVSMLSLPLASAADADGDGVDDSVDDCLYAAGNSTVDRNGCPDRDGDGTSRFQRWLDIHKSEFQKMSKLPKTTTLLMSTTRQTVQ